MPSKHHRPAAIQRRSTSGPNAKLTLSNLNLQRIDSSSNLQLQVALNNATKDLPRGKGKKSGARPNVCYNSTFQFFRPNPNYPSTLPRLLSQQPPSRTESDQQIRSSSKLHLQEQQPYAQRTTTGAPRLTSSQRPDATTATRSNKKSGFTLTSPVVATHEVEGEGDSDDWVSSESAPVTPQNQSSDSESGDEDDDVVRNLPVNLNLTGTAHIATSPDDREPPTPTAPQPPTLVNNAKEGAARRRLSTAFVPNEVGTNAVVDGVGRHNRTSSAGDHADALAVRSDVDQESVGDHDYPRSDHHALPEEGLASTPRPRAMVDRDTESSRHLPPDPLPDPPHSDSSARKPPVVKSRLGGSVSDRSQRPTLSALSALHSHSHIANDSSPGPRADNNPQGRDRVTMTQVSEYPPVSIINRPSCVRNAIDSRCPCPLIDANNSPSQHQQQHQQLRPPTPTRRKGPPLSSPPSPTHHRDQTRGGLSHAKHSDATKRSRTRPSSLHSLQPGKNDHQTMMTRPHPLIRGPSTTTGALPSPNTINIGNSSGSAYQNGVSTVPFGSGVGKLAPLTTVTAVPSVSPSPPNLSPVSLKQKGKEENEVKERLRRQSIASVSSVNTQRSLGRAAGFEYAVQGSGFRNSQRERTLSALSSSPYAALSALYPSYSQQSTSSQYSPKSPGTPSHPPGPACGFTSYFPSMEGDNVGLGGPTASELMHMLLPAPYLSAHMTVLKGRSPIREAVERVSRARKTQSS